MSVSAIYHQKNGSSLNRHCSFTLVIQSASPASPTSPTTVLINNPQPNGQAMEFNSQSLQTLDQSVNERVPAASADTGALGIMRSYLGGGGLASAPLVGIALPYSIIFVSWKHVDSKDVRNSKRPLLPS